MWFTGRLTRAAVVRVLEPSQTMRLAEEEEEEEEEEDAFSEAAGFGAAGFAPGPAVAPEPLSEVAGADAAGFEPDGAGLASVAGEAVPGVSEEVSDAAGAP